VIPQELLEHVPSGVRDQADEGRDRRIAHDRDGRFVPEVPGGARGLRARRGRCTLRQIPRRHAQAREQIDLFVFGAEPRDVCMAEHVVEHHDPAGNEGATRLPTVPVLRLTDGSIDGAGLQVIDAATVRALGKVRRQATSDQFLEKVAHALAVADAGKGGVLAAQAVAAVERHQRDESRLARRETEGFEPADAILERHRR